MNKTWPLERFGDVCDFVRGPFGGSLKKNIFKPEGFAIYEQQHAIYDQFGEVRYFIDQSKFEEMSRFELVPGDLIMSCSGTMGKVAIVPKGIAKGIINQALLKLTPNKTLDPKFLKLWMESRNFQSQIEEFAQGAAIKNMASVKILKEIKVPIPAIAEQQRIVATLVKAFAEIDQARATAEKNLINARELFDSYLQQVFNELDDCEYRMMSDESLLKMIDGDRGKNYPKKVDFLEEGHCLFLSTKNVRPNGFLFDELMFIDEERDRLLRKGKLERYDVVITTRGTIGNLALYDDSVDFDNVRINSGMLILRPNTNAILPSYLFEIMRSGIVRKQIKEKTSGAAQPQLPVKTLNTFSFPVPHNIEDQMKVVEKIHTLESLINTLELVYSKKLKVLDELKKSILQKAFTGELTKSNGAAA